MRTPTRHHLPLAAAPAPEACLGAWLGQGRPALVDGATGEVWLCGTGRRLESRWDGRAWISRLAGAPLPGSPWEALDAARASGPCPWVGAATFELASDEGGLPRKPLSPGTLGQVWHEVPAALALGPGGAALLGWEEAPPSPDAWTFPPLPGPPEPAPRIDLAPAWDETIHRAAVEAIRQKILEGGFYVANLCVPFRGRLQGPAARLARQVLLRAAPPHGACLDTGEGLLLSLSMERLLARRGDRLWSEPIKGSAPRSGDPAADQRTGEALAADPKERAEHMMIVDLIRNDLGRVSAAGTVRVARPMALRAFPTVLHLVSTVEGRARPGLQLPELLRALLPGGSVTGTPKHAVCGHLAGAEAGPRGFYCGALGWIGPDGDLDLALPIRTAVIRGAEVDYWTGGGITWRSDPAREWAELFLKTRALTG